jgi:hypothetical protein
MRRAVIASVALLAVLLGAGCLKTSPKQSAAPANDASAVGNLPFQKIEEYATSPDAPAAAPKDLDVPAADANVKPGETASASQNVVVSSVVKNQILPNPFVLLGRARVFENQISWRVRDGHGKALASGTALTNAPEAGTFGQFRVRSFYDRLPETAKGTVEVYTLAPSNGSEQDLVSIPVTFVPKVISVKAFFSNIKNDPGTLHCEKVYAATRRVPLTENVAEAAVLELLKGPSSAEQSIGFRTSIFPGTMLRSVILKDGTAIVDFTKEFLYAVAGSCHVQALSAQVVETLKQFPSVQNVKIFVEGQDAADKLQP